MKRLVLALLLLPGLAHAQIKVNALPASSAVGGADFTIDDQAGVTKRATFTQVLSFVQAGISVQCATLPALSGVITSSGCVTSWAAATGTGSTVLATSPTLVTPALGTPTAVVLTNASGLPATALPAFTGDVATSAGSSVTAIQPAAVTLADMANLAADSFILNATASAAAPQAGSPLAAANLMSAVFSVRAVATANITLSGAQTVDGVAVVAGQSVLAAGQTTTSQNGIYIVNAGAWTRAINFPTGYVLAQNCDVAVFIREGTAKQGHTYRLNTAGGAQTIGTTALSFLDAALGTATAANPGIVYSTSNVSAGAPVTVKGGTVGALSDCVSWFTIAGNLGDGGDANNVQGSCTTTNTTTGHINLTGSGTPPTASSGSIGCAPTDHRGCVTALTLTGASLTITFANTWAYNPTCFLSATTAQSALTVTSTTANVVFGGITIAAGTVNFLCF